MSRPEGRAHVGLVKAAAISLPLATVLYVLVSLTPQKQYAFIVAIGAFFTFSLLPWYQTYLAAKQLQVAEGQEARDRDRFAAEQAERKKSARLAITLWDQTSVEFFPIGGHRRPGSPVSFSLYVSNAGDAKASDVVATVALPQWAHPMQQGLKAAEPLNQPVERLSVPGEPDNEIRFAYDIFGSRTAEVGRIELRRPVYPEHYPQKLGLVVIFIPEGRHRFDWIVEASSGRTESDDGSAIYITVNDTALGHDPIPAAASADPSSTCRLCHALSLGLSGPLHSWGRKIEAEVERYRIGSKDQNPEGLPHFTQAPAQIQWYQEWTGPHKWVTCEVAFDSDRADGFIRALFWTLGHWNDRVTRTVELSDIKAFARDVCEFLGGAGGLI